MDHSTYMLMGMPLVLESSDISDLMMVLDKKKLAHCFNF